jgi:flagellar protein FliS
VYTNPINAAQRYANVGLETGVVAASPQKLIVMLYEGAELAVRMAMRHMKEGNLDKKGAAINKANAIILDGLRAALDFKQGDLAQQLDGLYAYMTQRLTLGHVKNDPAPLEEVLGLLRELREAWQHIGQNTPHPTLHSIAA